MNFGEFILNNYVTLFELIGLLVILSISVHLSNRKKIFTRVVIVLLFFIALVQFIEEWTQSFETYNVARGLLTATKYTAYPIVLILMIAMMTYSDKPIPFKKMIILCLPEIICVPLFYTTNLTHIICYFTPNNIYVEGPLAKLPYVLFVFYFIFFIAQNIIYFKRYKIKDKNIIIYITAGSFLCILLYLLFKKTVDYTPIFTAAIVFYYLYIYIHMASIDSLTGLFNRQSYYQDLESKRNKIRAIISIDMNELKYINDNYGHDKGDEALKTISKILLDNSGYNRAVYRVGGDEFIMFSVISDEQVIKRRIQNIKIELSKTPYSCAIGYAMRKEMDDISHTLKEADEKMYFEKRKMKEDIVNKGGKLHERVDI